jgi:uncharacterized protein DUF2612
MAWVTVLLQPFIDAGVLVGMMVNDFDIDLAIGPQLDILGQIIGAKRVVPFQPSGGVSPTLTDAVYKILLKAKIAQNQWKGQASTLYALWGQLFPGGKLILIDNQNMSVTVLLSGTFSSITQDLITNGMIIPRPEGVLYNYIFGTFPAFGFDASDDYIQGFDTGHWDV